MKGVKDVCTSLLIDTFTKHSIKRTAGNFIEPKQQVKPMKNQKKRERKEGERERKRERERERDNERKKERKKEGLI